MKRFYSFVLMFFLAGCAGMNKSCASCNAESFGADWIITQNRLDGTPFNCWKLSNMSVSNEAQSDGIYWSMPNGNLIHISGSYTKIQVSNRDWNRAANDIGIDLGKCNNGKY